MIDLGPHYGFIVASYAIAAGVLCGLIAWIGCDGRTQRRLLAELEAEGVARRSKRRSEDGDGGKGRDIASAEAVE
jgi:heme exporter protein D